MCCIRIICSICFVVIVLEEFKKEVIFYKDFLFIFFGGGISRSCEDKKEIEKEIGCVLEVIVYMFIEFVFY